VQAIREKIVAQLREALDPGFLQSPRTLNALAIRRAQIERNYQPRKGFVMICDIEGLKK